MFDSHRAETQGFGSGMAAMPCRFALDSIRSCWDVAVIGAGVAGANAARMLALQGHSVLLVERTAFPRYKVCGGCLNQRTVAALEAAGLREALIEEGARPLAAVEIGSGQRSARLPLPGGMALSRARLDALLVDAARAAGVTLLSPATASLGPVDATARTVHLRAGGEVRTVRARLVLAASGLTTELPASVSGAPPRIARASRIGVGTIFESPSDRFAPGTVYMACANGGYAGFVRVENGALAVAAALDPALLRRCGSAGAAVKSVLLASPFSTPEGIEHARWKGTPPLTREPARYAGERVVLLGDAAGYVEPFTGEGMGWAMASAEAVADLAARSQDWRTLGGRWDVARRRPMRRQRYICRATARLLRSPWATRALIQLLACNPGLSRPFIHRINAESRS